MRGRRAESRPPGVAGRQWRRCRLLRI
jgi:hypothetical protein